MHASAWRTVRTRLPVTALTSCAGVRSTVKHLAEHQTADARVAQYKEPRVLESEYNRASSTFCWKSDAIWRCFILTARIASLR
jgi:hypothetical protein